MSTRPYVLADAFSDRPLKGNPVAVFLDAAGFDDTDMQNIANELNLSETVFAFSPENCGDFRIRIFTPVNELPFAGHPALGAAAVLGQSYTGNRLILETKMGPVPFTLDRSRDGDIETVTMRQPIPTWQDYDQKETVLQALGLKHSIFPIEIYHNGPRHVFVGLPSIEALSALKPDHHRLAHLPDVAINCFAGENTEWRMRMFSPAYGVVEDAATGSAAGPLALHLLRHGIIDFSDQIRIHQGVEMGRHSLMHARICGSRPLTIDAIEVSGAVTVVARGEFLRWS